MKSVILSSLKRNLRNMSSRSKFNAFPFFSVAFRSSKWYKENEMSKIILKLVTSLPRYRSLDELYFKGNVYTASQSTYRGVQESYTDSILIFYHRQISPRMRYIISAFTITLLLDLIGLILVFETDRTRLMSFYPSLLRDAISGFSCGIFFCCLFLILPCLPLANDKVRFTPNSAEAEAVAVSESDGNVNIAYERFAELLNSIRRDSSDDEAIEGPVGRTVTRSTLNVIDYIVNSSSTETGYYAHPQENSMRFVKNILEKSTMPLGTPAEARDIADDSRYSISDSSSSVDSSVDVDDGYYESVDVDQHRRGIFIDTLQNIDQKLEEINSRHF
jgi:hypothetical protein